MSDSHAVLAAEIVRLRQQNKKLRKALEDLLPGEDCVTNRSVEAHLACGRWYLNVAGAVTVMETDRCRDADFGGGSWMEEDIKKIEEKFNAPIRRVLEECKED